MPHPCPVAVGPSKSLWSSGFPVAAYFVLPGTSGPCPVDGVRCGLSRRSGARARRNAITVAGADQVLLWTATSVGRQLAMSPPVLGAVVEGCVED